MQMDLCHIVAIAGLMLLRGNNGIYQNLEYIIYDEKLWLPVLSLKRQL